MTNFHLFGHLWIRLDNDMWRRHQVRECAGCSALTVQALQHIDADGVFCLCCLGTSLRGEMLNGERVFRCVECNAVTAFDAFVEMPAADEFFEPGDELYLDELDDDEDDEPNDWKRGRRK